VLDTACAKVALGQNATPARIESLSRQIERIDAEARRWSASRPKAARTTARLQELRDSRAAADEQLKALSERWEREKALTADIAAAQRRARHAGPRHSGHAGRAA
jgi:type VI secretion system protein VasG